MTLLRILVQVMHLCNSPIASDLTLNLKFCDCGVRILHTVMSSFAFQHIKQPPPETSPVPRDSSFGGDFY